MESNATGQSTNQSGSNFDWETEKQLQLDNISPEEKQRRLDALNRGDDPTDDQLSDRDVMEQDKDEGNWIQVARNIRRYKASINIMNVSGNNNQQKLRIVQQAIGDIDEFVGIKLTHYGKGHFITAEFGNKLKMQEACDREIETGNDYRLQPTLNYGDEEVKNRTLIVRDLPLNMYRNTLRQILEKKAKTNIVDMKVRVQGPYMVATVTFEKEEALTAFNNQWSLVYLKDLCRIEPANMTKEEREHRMMHTLKLSNLPFAITAYDLKEVIEQTGAKTCVLPRTRGNYTRQRYAYVNFDSDEAMVKAINQQFEIKGCRLYWVEAEKKVCHKCGSPDHLIKDCGEREQSMLYKQRRAQYSRIYTRYRVPNYRKYNNYNNNNYQRNDLNRQNLYDQQSQLYQRDEQQQYHESYRQRRNFGENVNNDRGENAGRNSTTKDNNVPHSNKDIMGMLSLLTKGMDEIRQEINTIKTRINKLEGNNTLTETPDQSQNLDANKGKDKDTNQQLNDKDKDKTITINKNNNPVNDQGNIGYNQTNQRSGSFNRTSYGNNNDNKRRTRFSDESFQNDPYIQGSRPIKRQNFDYNPRFERNNRDYYQNYNNYQGYQNYQQIHRQTQGNDTQQVDDVKKDVSKLDDKLDNLQALVSGFFKNLETNNASNQNAGSSNNNNGPHSQ